MTRCSFFFNDTATTEIYTLSLHDALPISGGEPSAFRAPLSLPCSFHSAIPGSLSGSVANANRLEGKPLDRKSTRLNSSHGYISYAVFCLKKKKATESPVRESLPPYRTSDA